MPRCELICGLAQEWVGEGVDLVLTNPYAPLPECLRGAPAILTDFADREARVAQFCGGPIVAIGHWSRGGRAKVWVRGLEPVAIDLGDLVEEEYLPGRGWFPLELPLRLLRAYAHAGMTICDPFMGRGTVGRACRMLGMGFVGIDREPERVEMAREYIG